MRISYHESYGTFSIIRRDIAMPNIVCAFCTTILQCGEREMTLKNAHPMREGVFMQGQLTILVLTQFSQKNQKSFRAIENTIFGNAMYFKYLQEKKLNDVRFRIVKILI